MNLIADQQRGDAGKPLTPILNSLRGYFIFLKFAAASILTAAVDNLIFILVYNLSGSIAASQVAGRLIACGFNYSVNKRSVFHSREHNVTALPKYALNVLVAGVLAYLAIGKLVASLHWRVITAKICAETAIFFFNFAVQRAIVFSTPPKKSLD